MTILLVMNLGFAWGTGAPPDYGTDSLGWTMPPRLPDWTMDPRLPDWTMPARIPDWTMTDHHE